MEQYQELLNFLEYSGKDPSLLIFEDELTGIYNRRFLYQYLQTKVSWNTLDQSPFSLIMMDVDNFKQINDAHGHQVGDQALVWAANLLKEVAGEDGLPVRYAGDEFMLLVPGDKRSSLLKGERLCRSAHESSFRPGSLDRPIRITFSIGVASAPDDATNYKALIKKADTALYAAKKRGRDCFVNASEMALEDVFDKTVIYQLDDAELVGRSRQMAQVRDALKMFSRKKSQFLIAEGSAGLGKTEFLETIRRNFSQKKIWQVRVNGTPQEMFSPYYLTAGILKDLLNQRGDKGAPLLARLDPKEAACLKQVIPQFGGAAEPGGDIEEGPFRKAIFTSLLNFIPQVVERRPFFVFVDDLHFGDEATLLLLRGLMLRGEIPLFICATSSSGGETKADTEQLPLERFRAAYGEELGIKKIALTPLEPAEIGRYIQTIFPNVKKPPNFENDLAKVSQGNPLFISEILRKLVQDEQIALLNQSWIIRPVDEGYLPKSLEEIVTQKIAALDEDGRKMLQQVSALGDGVSLSMLIGSSEAMESKVLEFIDQAAAQGLLQTDFQLNDEIIRFLGKRILEITYGSIDGEKKEALHERIGQYQETLYERQLLPSAATLAYHFKRSTDKEKAKNYERILASSNNRKFNAQEAVSYTDEMPEREPAADIPLDPQGLARTPDVIREFMIAVRNIKLYPPGSKSVIGVTQKLKSTVDEILKSNECLNIMQIEGTVVVNGQRVDTKDFKVVANDFLELLHQMQLKGIAFKEGLTEREVAVVLEEIGRTEQKTFDDHHWENLMAEQSLEHIDLKQIRYTRKGRTDPLSSGEVALKKAPPQGSEQVRQKETRLLVETLRGLLSVARSIRLYPLESKALSTILEKLTTDLRSYIKMRGLLTVSLTEDVLLVNGEKVAAAEFKMLGDTFPKYLQSIGLKSLTFLRRFTDKELRLFVAALGNLPTGVDGKFWKQLSQEQRFSGILFDRHLYDARVAEAGEESQESSEVVRRVEASGPQEEALEAVALEEEPFSSLLDRFSVRIRDLLLNNDDEAIREETNRLYRRVPDQPAPDRRRAIRISGSLVEGLEPAFQHDFAGDLLDPLLSTFAKEENPDLIGEMGDLLGRMVDIFVQFSEYRAAARILSHLQKRQRDMDEAKDPHAKALAKRLQRKLDHPLEKCLLADLTSAHPGRMRDAAHLLAGLGQAAVPFLIEIIKKEKDVRARKAAVALLRRQGPAVAKRLKELLVLEVNPEERSRILDEIDTLTPDLNPELSHALGDADPQVREAAFRLAERLNNPGTIEQLLDLANSQTGNVSVSAVECLRKLNPANVDQALIRLLNSSKEDGLCIACCRALGQIGSAAAIEPLHKILLPQGMFLFRKMRNPHLRAAAAFALGQIPHPDVPKALRAFVDDKDPRVREIARTAVSSGKLSAT